MDADRMLSAIELHKDHMNETALGLNLMVAGVGLLYGLGAVLSSDNPDQVKVRKDLMDARIVLGLAASKLENTEMQEYVQGYLMLVAELTVLAAH
jgi:hypothetical protein